MVTEDLTKPTESLISLLYQSVSIRDSRHSLELGVSSVFTLISLGLLPFEAYKRTVWRLSWITFIFLPLTFIVGFFGMFCMYSFIENRADTIQRRNECRYVPK